MTFDNLVFITHPQKWTEGLMAKYRFNNGKELSIVAGNNLYCTTRYGNRKGGPMLEVEDVMKWEVLIEGEDDVRGWQTREQINEIIKENS